MQNYISLRDFKGKILEDIGGNQLERIHISESVIENIEIINKYYNLKQITIRKCNLESIPNFSNLVKLEELRLSENSISRIEGLDNCRKLKKLVLNRNLIESLSGIEFLESLEYLYIEGGNLRDLNEFKNLAPLNNLTDVFIRKNPLSEINISQCVPNLEYLNLDSNEIEKIVNITNLPKLRILDLVDNKITKIENITDLGQLEEIRIDGNPIKSFSGFETLPKLKYVRGLPTENYTDEELYGFLEYGRKVGMQFNWEGPEIDWGLDYVQFDGRIPTPREEFKVNEYFSVKLFDKYSMIYVKDEEFMQCHYVLLDIPLKDAEKFDEIRSVDDMVNKKKKIAQEMRIPSETEFWGHCSNLQAWYEHDYDTRILHSNIAFPLLKKLVEVGDPLALKVFKEEIAKRYESGHPSVVKFLEKEGYLEYLDETERESLRIKV